MMDDDDFMPPHWGFGGRFGRTQMMQARRGDMRGIILNALKTRPMHGYEVIRHLEEQSHGMWRPSPGSVYPTLQLLEEEDLVTAHEDEGGKKTYTLTKAGEESAKKAEDEAPWKRGGFGLDTEDKKEFKMAIGSIFRSFKAIAHSDDPAASKQALEVLKETHRKLNDIAEKTGASKDA
jgi:DNA-binding PadR family transcriptional regulator